MYIVYFWKQAYFKEKYEQKRKDFYRQSVADLENNEVQIDIGDDQEQEYQKNLKIQRFAFDSILVLVMIYQIVFVYQITKIDPNNTDKDDVFKQTKVLMRVMNLAINKFLTIFACFILSLRYMATII